MFRVCHCPCLPFCFSISRIIYIMGGTDSPLPTLADTNRQHITIPAASKEWLTNPTRRCHSPSSLSTASSSAYSTCSDTTPVLPPRKHVTLTRRNTSPIRYVPNSKAMVNLDMKMDRRLSVDYSRKQKNNDESTCRDVLSSPSSPVRAYMECLSPQSLKCVLVGDSGVGKTSMLMNYTTETFVKQHTPTIYDKFTSK